MNAVAAYEKYRTAMIIVDFGTATTFDYVSEDGAYQGGAIAPGVVISSEALFQKASKLPRVEIFARPKSVLAKDTISSMNVGIIYGYAGLVDGIVGRIKEAMSNHKPKVIATGGLAEGIRLLVNEAMRQERSQALQAQPYERTKARQGHANGFKPKTLATRVGPIQFRVPQVRGIVNHASELEHIEGSATLPHTTLLE